MSFYKFRIPSFDCAIAPLTSYRCPSVGRKLIGAFPLKPFQLIFMYAKKYKLALTITAISMLLLVGAQLLIPWIVKVLVAAVTAPGASMDVMSLITRLTAIVLIVYVARAGLQSARGGNCAGRGA